MGRLTIGMMHVETMTGILTGLKPLQALLNVSLFLLRIYEHVELLEALRTADASFRDSFHVSANWARGRRFLIALCVFVGLVPFGGRLSQFILGGEQFGQFWLADFSLLLVPTITILQFLPLFYFVYLNSLLRFWFRRLEKLLSADEKCCNFSLNFYYKSVGTIAVN